MAEPFSEVDLFFWANRQWPNRTLATRLRKLGEEVGELNEAIALHYQARTPERREAILEECADVANILVDICWLLKGSLGEAQAAKLAKLLAKERTDG